MLVIQPVITLAAFVAVPCLNHVPVGRFGLVAILSGFDGSCSKAIEGATLSGDTKGPVRLEVVRCNTEEGFHPVDAAQDGHSNTIQYRLVGAATGAHRRPW